MNPIRTNKPVFFGDNGEVLKSGNIYIGQPNQWPLDFPKTVTLQDSSGSQFTAEQPLKTNNQGRIEYNGKAVMALVDGDYSVLVRDRNGVTVGEGYTPFVEGSAETPEEDSVTQVGLLLEDIKLFDVTPGETVRNVGKLTSLDSLGADWLVVSATGNPADDVDLIDFTNGTQGVRDKSVRYSKDTIQVDEGGTGATDAETARANLSVIEDGAGTVSESNLADDSVSTAKIQDDSVTTPKIPDDAITAPKLAETASERDWVLGRVSQLSAGAVGSFGFFLSGTQPLSFGDTVAGSQLTPSSAGGGSGSPQPSGTWRCLGDVPNGATTDAATTLFLRVA